MSKSEQLVALVEKMLELLGVTATVKLQERGTTYVVNIETDDSALMIGRKGETLEALQLLVRLMAGKLELGEEARVMLDINAYRREQEENLLTFVNEVAERVKESGMAETLRPMSSYERHLVHEVVSHIDGVASESTGEGRDRRITIRPE